MSAAPEIAVLYRPTGPAWRMSSALPAATSPASSMSLISPSLPRSASRCAIALPMGPAPMIAADDIGRILIAESCLEAFVHQEPFVTGGTKGIGRGIAAALLAGGRVVSPAATRKASRPPCARWG